MYLVPDASCLQQEPEKRSGPLIRSVLLP